MRRSRRFPLLSTIVVLLIAGGVGYVCFLDVDVPQTALRQIGDAVSGLTESVKRLFGSASEGLPVKPQEPTPMLVNASHPVASGYAPDALVRMADYCDSSVVTIKGNDIYGNRKAVDALMEMLRAAISEGVGNWQVSAGYRSVTYQQDVWNSKVREYEAQGLSPDQAQTATAKYVALPGASEHHTGLAFDMTVPGESFPLTRQSKWLAERCWDYGFIIRYAEDKVALTGINAEPWHIRYVGQPHARIMREKNWCLEEYVDSLNQ